MPALAWVLVAGTRSRGRLVRLTLLALGFSWLGDTVPRFTPDDSGFLVMVGFFLLAQFAYVAAFLPSWRASAVGSRPLLLLPYAAGFVALVALTKDGAGSLLVPVLVYGFALVSMAVLATGLGWVAGLGGAIFFVSDGLIALRSFADLALPAHGFWVMLTYVVGQSLLVLAVIRLENGRSPTSGPSGSELSGIRPSDETAGVET
jgi:uncharacterized membrane protein YhhN